jgi:crossover junction endodeoxyribonuclease RuvC
VTRKVILALDLGTKCGFAVSAARGVVVSGTWNLADAKDKEARFLRFREYLDRTHKNYGLTHIGFELVAAHKGTQAGHIYGGFKAVMFNWCADNVLGKPVGVPVGTLKKYWCGKGNADKTAMIARAREAGYEPADDNEADAIALLHYICGEEGHQI